MPTHRRVILLVLDGVGIGAAADAAAYGDEGSNSIANSARAVGGLHLPVMGAMGLGNICPIQGVSPTPAATGAFGKLAERSRGKDTVIGHWELAGIYSSQPQPTYPDGFPPAVIEPFTAAIGRGVLGNRPASGTEIIRELGAEHLRTGRPSSTPPPTPSSNWRRTPTACRWPSCIAGAPLPATCSRASTRSEE